MYLEILEVYLEHTLHKKIERESISGEAYKHESLREEGFLCYKSWSIWWKAKQITETEGVVLEKSVLKLAQFFKELHFQEIKMSQNLCLK